MREIKFRAFNKAERKMCRVVSIDFTGFITVRFPEFEHESDDYNDQMLIEEFEPLMQFTGLKDKNGKEIYEGDIVKHATDEDVYKIIFEDGGFYVLSSCDFQTINEYPLEVIGNIYENPELLEGEGEMNEICPTCNGSGGIDMFEDSIGEIVIVPCSDCRGSGESND